MTTTAATRADQFTASAPVLHLAFELGQAKWKLGFTTGLGQRPRERTMAARDLPVLAQEIQRAQERFGLAADAPVVSCYEAGREGFWLHRWLVAHGVESHVVDSASIEVNRRRRRAKSDRLDVGKLLYQLVRYRAGERKVWSVVRVPTVAEEDQRQLHRELLTAKRDRARVTNRMKGLLANQGIVVEVGAGFLAELAVLELWDGTALPPGVRARLEREWAKVALFTGQIGQLEGEREEALRSGTAPAVELVRYLAGERKVWSVVRVPTVAEEDQRQLHRELLTAKRDRARVTNRMKGLLANQGVVVEVGSGCLAELAVIQLWDGTARRRGCGRGWNGSGRRWSCSRGRSGSWRASGRRPCAAGRPRRWSWCGGCCGYGGLG